MNALPECLGSYGSQSRTCLAYVGAHQIRPLESNSLTLGNSQRQGLKQLVLTKTPQSAFLSQRFFPLDATRGLAVSVGHERRLFQFLLSQRFSCFDCFELRRFFPSRRIYERGPLPHRGPLRQMVVVLLASL